MLRGEWHGFHFHSVTVTFGKSFMNTFQRLNVYWEVCILEVIALHKDLYILTSVVTLVLKKHVSSGL